MFGQLTLLGLGWGLDDQKYGKYLKFFLDNALKTVQGSKPDNFACLEQNLPLTWKECTMVLSGNNNRYAIQFLTECNICTCLSS